MPTIGRNDPCPCGSGKKYKRCCLARAEAEERERGSRDRGVPRALAWLEEHHGEAVEEAWEEHFGGLSDEEHLRIGLLPSGVKDMLAVNTQEWLLAEGEIEVEGELRLANEVVLGPGGPRFDASERRWLEAHAEEPLALWEVQEVQPGVGLSVRNVFEPDDEPRWAVERTASRTLQRWDLIGARLIPWEGHWELSGCIYPFKRWQHLSALRAMVGRELRSKEVRSNPEEKPWVVGLVLRELWLQILTAPPPPLPQLVDLETGDPTMLVTDHYQVTDWGRLADALATQPDVEGDHRRGWTRFVELGGDMRRSRLSLNVAKGGRLEAFARTLARADEGRDWFTALAGGSVAFDRREVVDPREALEERGDLPRPEPAGRAVRMTTALAQAMYDNLYRGWADEPLPILKGKTPRQALRSRAGRQQVIDLLKTYENGELRRAGEENRPPASLEFLWKELGLTKA